mgnify:CR=1 FL=1
MDTTINFGIDLGTTNSLIAKFEKGDVTVFKNPSGHKESIPSAVGYRKERVLVGEQALRYLEKDPKNVFSRFKRKMGTTESYQVASLGQSKTPVQLSAEVLKEMKTFIHTGESPKAAVITIPASFDTVQSNDTQDAGYAAGFEQVLLLQEPIAASLAYANTSKNIDLDNKKWIVYDLGGGTFDVALVKVDDGEIKVVDHEGNNFLGGVDFDAVIVEELIVPYLESQGRFENLLDELKSENGKYNKLWYVLLDKAEELKIDLTTKTSSDIDLGVLGIEDEDGVEIDEYFTVTRSEFESLIKDSIAETADLLKAVITRNKLRPEDLDFVLMVGGSTYIPYVRSRISELIGIDVNTDVDPTNAIVVGAAYFAGTKDIKAAEDQKSSLDSSPHDISVKLTYTKASHDDEETLLGKVEGNLENCSYRITRQDGGYDSGLKALKPRIMEDLPLVEKSYNFFSFAVYDKQGNEIDVGAPGIQIAHGKFSVAGQVLPEDICLVTDDYGSGEAVLECVFVKNSTLPQRFKRTFEVSRQISKGTDDQLRIMIVEGAHENYFSANKTIGYLCVSGKEIERDIYKGTEIDLVIEMDESRKLTIKAFVNPSGPEYAKIFEQEKRQVASDTLVQEVQNLQSELEREINDAEENEELRLLELLRKIEPKLNELQGSIMLMTVDDVTDDKFKYDDQKRKIAQDIYDLTKDKKMTSLVREYNEAKELAIGVVNESGSVQDQRKLQEVIKNEPLFLESKNPKKIADAIDKLGALKSQIFMKSPKFIVALFDNLVNRRSQFSNQAEGARLIDAGRQYIQQERYDDVRGVMGGMWDLLPEQEKAEESDAASFLTGLTK